RRLLSPRDRACCARRASRSTHGGTRSDLVRARARRLGHTGTRRRQGPGLQSGRSFVNTTVIETIINKSEQVKKLKKKAQEGDLTAKQKKQLSDEEKEYKSKRKLIQEKLIKFATRIPAFMYLTDYRENTLQDVITKLEPE